MSTGYVKGYEDGLRAAQLSRNPGELPAPSAGEPALPPLPEPEAYGAQCRAEGYAAGRAESEAADGEATRDMMADILTRTVNALRGTPPPLTLWSWHDLPERAAAAIAAIDVMQRVAALLAPTAADATPAAVGSFVGSPVMFNACPPDEVARWLSLHPPAPQWQPMSTAPTDGTTILLLVPTRHQKWNKTLPIAGQRFGGDQWCVFNGDEAVQTCSPLGWMPCPPAAGATSGGE